MDDFVKSPSAALCFVLRRCSVAKSTPHSSGLACLASGAFYFAVFLLMFLLLRPIPAFADQPPVKIFIQESGIYSVTSTELEAAGFSIAGLDLNTLQITNRGAEIPVLIETNPDGNFEVVFYAVGIARGAPEFEFTDMNVYWLSAGTEVGKRIEVKNTPSGGGTTPVSFLTTLHLENDNTYSLLAPPETDYWFWDVIPDPTKEPSEQFPVTRIYNFTINYSDPNQTISVRASLRGTTGLGHHTRVYLNGCLADDDEWFGAIQWLHESEFSGSCLLNGQNTLTLESLGDFEALVDGDIIDRICSNWFEIDYRHPYVAENDVLEFTVSGVVGDFTSEISGFSEDAVDVFDVTDSYDVMRVSNSASSGSVTFTDTLAQGETRRYVAITMANRKTPQQLLLDTPSNLREPNQGADYLIIIHQDFLESVESLAAHRSGQGLRVAVMEITDVYDEFSHGISDPIAIKDFLAYTFDNWQRPAPSYVLLVGDATIDYKDNLKNGNGNFIPALLIHSEGIKIPSDHSFVTLKGDDPIPEMFIGRLPVRTKEEADNLVKKIVEYETYPPFESSDAPFLFVADQQPDPLGAGNFHDLAEDLALTLSDAGYPTDTLFAEDPYIKSLVINQINQGSPIATYIGHGTSSQWSFKEILTIRPPYNDVEALDNGPKQPFVIALSCVNNYFISPFSDSLGEVFVRAKEKGAIAFWAGTGLGFIAEQAVISTVFFEEIASGKPVTLGPSTAAAIQPVIQGRISEDTVSQLALLGDPALSLSLSQSSTDEPPDSTSVESDSSGSGSGGGGGSGCSVAQNAEFDPLFPILIALTLFYLFRRWGKDVKSFS